MRAQVDLTGFKVKYRSAETRLYNWKDRLSQWKIKTRGIQGASKILSAEYSMIRQLPLKKESEAHDITMMFVRLCPH
jgi:hypothetical protein